MHKLRLLFALCALVLAVLASSSPASARPTLCGAPFTAPEPEVLVGGEVDHLVVPRGTFCILEGTRVRGHLLVEPDAGLFTAGVVVGGGVNCDRCLFMDIIGSSVGGSVRTEGLLDGLFVHDSEIAGNLRVGESFAGGFGFQLLRNRIGGGLKFDRNTGDTRIEENLIGGDLRVFQNVVGPFNIVGNTIDGHLRCAQNDPPPIGGANTAAHKEGQCQGL